MNRKESSEGHFTGIQPPWIRYPDFPPMDGFWRQTGEMELHVWISIWQKLKKNQREEYLRKWGVPTSWRDIFFEKNELFHDWAYGISYEDNTILLEKLFGSLLGQPIVSIHFLKESYLCIGIGKESLWKLSLEKAAWQLVKEDTLEAASSDDPELIEQKLKMFAKITLDNIRIFNSYNDVAIDFSDEIKIRTFRTQAILDVGDVDQWKLYTPEDTVLCSSPNQRLRYEISTPFSL